MSYVIRRYEVMQKVLREHASKTSRLQDFLPSGKSACSEWTVLELPEKPYLALEPGDAHDQFVSDCLKYIPVAFWQGKSREEIVLTYLSAVDDAMGLLAENIAARITKEVKGT